MFKFATLVLIWFFGQPRLSAGSTAHHSNFVSISPEIFRLIAHKLQGNDLISKSQISTRVVLFIFRHVFISFHVEISKGTEPEQGLRLLESNSKLLQLLFVSYRYLEVRALVSSKHKVWKNRQLCIISRFNSKTDLTSSCS